MEVSRQRFIGGAAAVGLSVGLWPKAAMAESSCIMRLGVVSDTHIGRTSESCRRAKLAMELFRSLGVDAVINCGDIAELHYPTGYVAYREMMDNVFSGGLSRPLEVYAYAWHDACAYRGRWGSVVQDAPQAFDDVQKLLKAPNGHTASFKFNGYRFLIMPQFTGCKGFLSWKEYEKAVASACRETPDRPVFVIDHVPPFATVYCSGNWGSWQARQILNRYPQVVVLSGHVHGSLRNDMLIWQREFTVINAGCLQEWSGHFANASPAVRQSYGVVTVDVYPEQLLVRRWDIRDRSEIESNRRWSIPLPFSAKDAPYRIDNRRRDEIPPQFRTQDALTVSCEGMPFSGWRLKFPGDTPDAMCYRVAVQSRDVSGSWRTFASREVISEYWMRPSERTGGAECFLPDVLFEPSRRYRFAVTPVGQYGSVGKELSVEVTAPKEFRASTVVFESKDPANEYGFFRASGDKARHRSNTDGFCGPTGADRNFLKLPTGAFKGSAGARFRLVLDMQTSLPRDGAVWYAKLWDAAEGRAVSGRIVMPAGEVRTQYVFDYVKKDESKTDTCYVCFEWSGGGKVRFCGVKLVRFEKER